MTDDPAREAPPGEEWPESRAGRAAVLLGIALLVLVAFHGVLENGFVRWDDQHYVTENTLIQLASRADLVRLLTQPYYWSYIPVTMLSHAADYALWGLNPRGHHLTGLLLHAANAVLMFVLSRRLLGKLLGITRQPVVVTVASVFAALLFALHPLRVESVSWVSDRKDLLCAFFLFLTLLAYINWREAGDRGRGWRALAAIFYLLALLSKASAVTMPFVIAGLDLVLWERGTGRERLSRLLRNTWPFFAVSFVIGVIGMFAVPPQKINFLAAHLSPVQKALLPLYSLALPLAKFVWPFRLAAVYDYPSVVVMAIAAVIVVLITVVCLVAFRLRHPVPLMLWLSYIVLSVPTALFFTSGIQPIADRYSYISMIGFPILLAGWGAGHVAASHGSSRGRKGAAVLLAAGCVVLVLSSVRIAQQVPVWRTSQSLWEHASRISPGSPVVYNNLGEALITGGFLEEAIVAYTIAAEIRPDYSDALNNLGVAYLLKREFAKGILALERARDLMENGQADNTSLPDVYYNLGMAYAELGEAGKSIEMFRSALAVRKDYADASRGLGATLWLRGDSLEGTAWLRRAAIMGDSAARSILQRGGRGW